MKPHNRKTISPDVALERLMALCVGAEHCRHEMMAKLSSWGIAPDNALRSPMHTTKPDSMHGAAGKSDSDCYKNT